MHVFFAPYFSQAKDFPGSRPCFLVLGFWAMVSIMRMRSCTALNLWLAFWGALLGLVFSAWIVVARIRPLAATEAAARLSGPGYPSGKNPGHVMEISWTCPGKVHELAGKCTGFFWNCPGNVRENSRMCLGHVLEMSFFF